MADKTFFIFTVEDDDSMRPAEALPRFSGTIVDARKVIGSEAFPQGRYRILEDTSGIITKTVESTPKAKVTFEAPRKRPRQSKRDGDPELVDALNDSIKASKKAKK